MGAVTTLTGYGRVFSFFSSNSHNTRLYTRGLGVEQFIYVRPATTLSGVMRCGPALQNRALSILCRRCHPLRRRAAELVLRRYTLTLIDV